MRRIYRTAGQYYDTYRTVVRQQSARGLWLGIRLARESGDRDAEGSYALALSNLYPKSPEYRSVSTGLCEVTSDAPPDTPSG